jgi:hypothetical protein
MPKPMKMMVEVEEFAHGRIFRLLDGTDGVVSITPIGDGPRSQRPAGGARQKKGGAQSVSCLVLGALIKTPGLTREQLFPVLEGNGKKRTSLPDTLQKLKKAGEIRASGTGKRVNYKITPIGKKRFETACQIQPQE